MHYKSCLLLHRMDKWKGHLLVVMIPLVPKNLGRRWIDQFMCCNFIVHETRANYLHYVGVLNHTPDKLMATILPGKQLGLELGSFHLRL